MNEQNVVGEHIHWCVFKICLLLIMFWRELDVVVAKKFAAQVVLKCSHWGTELWGRHLRLMEEVFAYPIQGGRKDEPPSHGAKDGIVRALCHFCREVIIMTAMMRTKMRSKWNILRLEGNNNQNISQYK